MEKKIKKLLKVLCAALFITIFSVVVGFITYVIDQLFPIASVIFAILVLLASACWIVSLDEDQRGET